MTVRPMRIILSKHTDKITCIAATQTHLFTGSEDSQARQFEIETGVCVSQFVGHYGPIFDLCTSEHWGLITAGYDAVIRRWDVQEIEATKHTTVCTYTGHKSLIMVLKLKDDILYSVR